MTFIHFQPFKNRNQTPAHAYSLTLLQKNDETLKNMIHGMIEQPALKFGLHLSDYLRNYEILEGDKLVSK